MGGQIRVVNGGAQVTKTKPPTMLSLNKQTAGFNQTVVQSWSGASAGVGNPIDGYEVYQSTSETGSYTFIKSTSENTVSIVTGNKNGSTYYKVKTIGKIAALSSEQSEAYAQLITTVTAVTAPTQISLSATDVALGKTVTQSWFGAQAGTNNPITGYIVYRNGAEFTQVTGTSLNVQAPSSDGTTYRYAISTKGTVPGYNSGMSKTVSLTAHNPTYSDVAFVKSSTYVIPTWADRLQVCCIGGGGGRGAPGYNYGTTYPGGGYGGGGTGEKKEVTLNQGRFTPGSTVTVTVGNGGIAAPNSFESGRAGEASSFGSMVSARGGKGGRPGDASSSTVAPNGGAGGAGGLGGAGGGWSRYGPNSGNIGAQGKNGESWSAPSSDAAYYPFSDASIGRRLGTGGAGGTGVNTGNAQVGNTTLPGTRYGSGGGGNNNGDGGKGLVVVRVWRYLA